ncbi:MAG: DUF5069 domain-containing protein [Verrucomicrobiae bacterium]|nr:DUF5069 domain-containing protein [Verrucomicrobiae bacterium]
MAKIIAFDLTKRPPRSPRARLGGYAILPRILDKGRAVIAGTNGEYNYACPLDLLFLRYVGVDAEKLKARLAAGDGDGEILAWIRKNATNARADEEIATWTAYMDRRAPSSVELRAYFHDLHAKLAPARDDIVTWFDLLDLDDHASFGGPV